VVVAVLMIGCHVSTVPIKKYDGAHTNISTKQSAKNPARETSLDEFPANLSKNTPAWPTRPTAYAPM
jgi:hypothetical protein